jgi:hypothetical protein
MASVFDPRVFSPDTHKTPEETAEEREAPERDEAGGGPGQGGQRAASRGAAR